MEELIKNLECRGAALLVFDEQRSLSRFNAQALEILHASPENLSGLPLREIDALFADLKGEPIPEEDRPLHQAVARGEKLTGRGFTLARKDGSHECILLNILPFFSDDGALKGLVAYFDRCCRTEERLGQFLGAMDEIAFEFDSEGHYLNVWSENEELLKVPRHHLLGHRFDEFIPQTIGNQVFEAFRRIRETGKPETFEYPLEVLGGKRWFLARIALVPPVAEGGEPTFSFLARDVTRQKKLEQNLRESEKRFRGLFEHAALAKHLA